MNYDEILSHVLKFEGGFVDDPDDSGGATNFGVTQKVYDSYRKLKQNTPQSVRYITKDEVSKIYESYWKECRASDFVGTHPRTAFTHFDFSINAGPNQAAKTLQRSIGGLLVDGIIGPHTLTGVSLSTDIDLARDYCVGREEFYKELVIRKPKNQKFLKGWLYRVRKVREIINDLP